MGRGEHTIVAIDERMSVMIDAAVSKALGGTKSLEHWISVALFDRKPQPQEPAWPKWAQRVWDEAVHRFQLRIAREEPTIETVWDVILARAPDPAKWWEIPFLGWSDLAQHFQIGERNATYRLQELQHWKFEGKLSKRRISVAPCVACHKPTPFDQITNRRCRSCHGTSN